MQTHHLTALACIAFAGCGGGAESHDLGTTADSLPVALNTDNSAPVTSLEPWAGTWIGEAQDPLVAGPDGTAGIYRFPSGERRFELEIIPPGSASLVFGDEAPPPAPVDFEAGYPPGVDYLGNVPGAPAAPGEALAANVALPPVEGFQYALSLQSEPDGLLRFYYSSNQAFGDWCAGQVPQPEVRGYGCLGAASSSYRPPVPEGADSSTCTLDRAADGDAGDTPVDCNKLILCTPGRSVCSCTQDGCGINGDVKSGLFLRSSGNELIGSFVQSAFTAASGHLTTLGAVRFRRAE